MAEAGPRRRLLVVEDDDVLRGRLARAFRERGFDVHEAESAATAKREGLSAPPDCAVVDLRLKDASGLDVVRALVAARPEVAVVVLTGYGSIATALEAVRLGARHYLTKPADVDEIVSAFARERPAAPPPAAVPTLARVEWEHINRVLADCGGNVSRAARVLGIHRRSLQRKLAKFPVAALNATNQRARRLRTSSRSPRGSSTSERAALGYTERPDLDNQGPKRPPAGTGRREPGTGDVFSRWPSRTQAAVCRELTDPSPSAGRTAKKPRCAGRRAPCARRRPRRATRCGTSG